MTEQKPLRIGDLTVPLPLIQGGMGVGVSLSGLAGAVAKSGGIGLISTAQIGFRDPEFRKNPIETNLRVMKEELDKARAIAPKGILGFNIMVATKRYEDYVKAALKAGADIIVSGAGLPVDLPKYAKGFKTKLAPIVSSLKAAKLICKLWDRRYQTTPDLVVIEGPKAGGHLGFSEEELKTYTDASYEEEIKKIISAVRECGEKYHKEIPVVVAGGIYNGDDVQHMLEEVGADGVQVGTRFVTTEECDAPMSYKERYLNAKEEDIVITKSPVGMPGRAIRNSFLTAGHTQENRQGECLQCLEKCNPAQIPYCITQALVNAVTEKTEQALLFCGSNAYRSERMETVPRVIADLFGFACNPA